MRFFYLLGCFLMSLFLFSCKAEEKKAQKSPETPTDEKKVCLALGYSGSGDSSFNDMQYNGLMEASHRYAVKISYGFPAEDTEEAVLKLMKDLLKQEHCRLMITSGYLAIGPAEIMARKYPGVIFALLDEIAKPMPNLISVIFSEQEGSFLAGYLAARVSKTKKIAFLGGVNIPAVKNFQHGFEKGVYYAKTPVHLRVQYLSKIPDFSGFTRPDLGFQAAGTLYAKGFDVIYAVAGASGNGMIQAALENKKWVIGVDSDQDYMAPPWVLTSMMKRLDLAVIDLCGRLAQGRLTGGEIIELGLSEGGIALSPMQYTRHLIAPDVLKKLDEIKGLMASKTLRIENIRRRP